MNDYIKREDAIEILAQKQRDICPMGRCGRGYVYGRDRDEYDTIEADLDAIRAIPAEDVVPVVHGHFLLNETSIFATCDNCQCNVMFVKNTVFRDGKGRFNFYPNCGAKMGGDGE